MNHCSDEQLLAWLDGETSPVESVRVEKHVADCWRCRAVVQTLEEDIAALVRKFRESEASSIPDRRALSRVLASCQATVPTPRRAWLRHAAVPAFACLLLVFLIWQRPTAVPVPAAPNARAIAMEAARAEATVAPGTRLVGQTLTISIEETRPKRRSRTVSMRVWSELAGGRSAVHWEGRIVPASYRPGVSLADSLVAADSVEEGLLRWFEARAPQPLSLARTLIEYADLHGLRIEWKDSWLVVERTDGSHRIALRLQLDSKRRVVLSAVRLDSPERAWQFTIRQERSAVFSSEPPSNDLFVAPAVLSRIGPVSARTSASAPAPDFEAAEIHARYALHRAGLDRGQFKYVPAGSELVVRATAASNEERQAWTQALSGHAYLRLDFSSNPSATAEEVMVVPPDPQSEAPLDAMLKRHFLAQPGDAKQRGAHMTAWLNEVVELSQDGMRAAWSVRRLAARYQDADMRRLRAEERWLLEAMLRDDIADLDRSVARQQILLEPVLGSVKPGELAPVPTRWADACERLFGEAQRTQELLLALLTGGGALPAGLENSIQEVRARLANWPAVRARTAQIVTSQFGLNPEEP